MRIAVPEYQGRIAPSFDSCRRILLVDRTASPDSVAALDWSTLSRELRPARLKLLDVDTLICGAISNALAGQIRARKIGLVSWLVGDIREVLEAFFAGRVSDPRFAMPGRRIPPGDAGTARNLP